MVKDKVEAGEVVNETTVEQKERKFFKPVDCCCPSTVLFVFQEVNCVQIFNGSCEDWRPGGPCVKNVY